MKEGYRLLKDHVIKFQHLGHPVTDIQNSSRWLIENLGFQIQAQFEVANIPIWFLRSGDLVLELYQFTPGPQHDEISSRVAGHFDHFALDAADIEIALRECKARKLTLETDNGNCFAIPECWDQGVQYFNIIGPNGLRVEVAHRNGKNTERPVNIEGWAHLGLPVTDIQISEQFYTGLGFKPVMKCSIGPEEQIERIHIVMMALNGFILELYQLLPADLISIKSRKDGQIDHVSLMVDSVEAAFAAAQVENRQIVSDGIESLPIWANGCRYFIIRGPDVERIEFNQIL